jgi:hypothetical protein
MQVQVVVRDKLATEYARLDAERLQLEAAIAANSARLSDLEAGRGEVPERVADWLKLKGDLARRIEEDTAKLPELSERLTDVQLQVYAQAERRQLDATRAVAAGAAELVPELRKALAHVGAIAAKIEGARDYVAARGAENAAHYRARDEGRLPTPDDLQKLFLECANPMAADIDSARQAWGDYAAQLVSGPVRDVAAE